MTLTEQRDQCLLHFLVFAYNYVFNVFPEPICEAANVDFLYYPAIACSVIIIIK